MREDVHVFRRALDLRLKVKEDMEGVKVGLRRKDALCQSKLCVGVNQIATGLR